MNLKSRLRKLEKMHHVINSLCFCGKTLIDLWYKPNAKPLTYCRNCKDKFDWWKNLCAEAAAATNNLTDYEY